MKITKKFRHSLMENNITLSDRKAASNYILKNNIFTQSEQVRKFEKKWSRWLGVKHSVFVNSGSSANYLTMLVLKILKGTGDVIVPPLTWNSDIVSVINNGFRPIFVDINLNNLSMNVEQILKKINKKTKAVFLTHAQGFNGINRKLLSVLKKRKIWLIEDVCESHGAKFLKKKIGTFGKISNFSFYYAHHLSTIEGGMVCTNDKKIYELVKILRGHGLLREAGNRSFENKIKKKYKMLSPNFIFLYPGFNMRNNEIQATIGLNQLNRLDSNNLKRSKNFIYFLKNLDSKKYYVNFDIKGNSNYAFPVILNKKSFKNRDKLEKLMKENNIEFRRGNAGGGNQMRQPYLKNIISQKTFFKFPNVEHVHSFGYYIGNYPSLEKKKINKIVKILNSLKI
jgi:CDP-6-deoxy-D-xylo-4-hexulose-3-dehydrase